jgi:ferric-dicitrate binding protein FerR (iron transport regulator)
LSDDYQLLIQKYLNETISKKDSTTFDSIVTRPKVKDELLQYLKAEADLRSHYIDIDISEQTMAIIQEKKTSGDISEILKPLPKKKVSGKLKKRKKLTDTVIIPKSKAFQFRDTDALRKAKPLRDSQRLTKYDGKSKTSRTTRTSKKLKNSSESGTARQQAQKRDLIYILSATAVFAIVALTVIIVNLTKSTEDGLGQISKFHGQGKLIRNDQTLVLNSDMRLEKDDRIQLSEKAECRIKYTDEISEVVLAGGSKTDISAENNAKRFYLHKGIMYANIAPQPKGKAVIITTPYGKVLLEEAQYRLEQNEEFMQLDILNGLANFESASGVKKATVKVGQFAKIGPRTPLKVGVSKR